MNFEDAKPEHIQGKTVESSYISGSSIEIKFTDGTEVDFNIEYYGYGGARIDSNFWPKGSETNE